MPKCFEIKCTSCEKGPDGSDDALIIDEGVAERSRDAALSVDTDTGAQGIGLCAAKATQLAGVVHHEEAGATDGIASAVEINITVSSAAHGNGRVTRTEAKCVGKDQC